MFTELPDEDLKKMVNENSSSVTFHCEASGVPAPRVAWLKDGNEVTETDKLIIMKNKSSSVNFISIKSTLTLVSPSKQDTGLYWCHASNLYYSVEMQKKYQLDVLEIKIPPGKCIPSLHHHTCYHGTTMFVCRCHTATSKAKECQ